MKLTSRQLKIARAEIDRHSAAALDAFTRQLDAAGASPEQKAEALAFMRERLGQNARDNLLLLNHDGVSH